MAPPRLLRHRPGDGPPQAADQDRRGQNQTEARAALRAWQKELDGRRGATDSPRPGRGMAAPQQGPGPGPRTLHDARRSAVTVIFPEFGDVPIADPTPRHLDEWYRKLVTDEGRALRLKPASISRHHAVLSASLSQAVRWGWLDRNPAERAQPPPLGHVELQVPSVEKVQALLSRGAERNERWGMLLSLAVLTGARRGELCALRWTDIEDERIRIRRSLYREGTDRGEKSTKGGRERWVVVAPAGRTLLEAWRARCGEVAAAADVTLVRDAFVVSPLPDAAGPGSAQPVRRRATSGPERRRQRSSGHHWDRSRWNDRWRARGSEAPRWPEHRAPLRRVPRAAVPAGSPFRRPTRAHLRFSKGSAQRTSCSTS